LAVALITGADADHRKRELAAEVCRQRRWHVFHHQGKAASGL